MLLPSRLVAAVTERIGLQVDLRWTFFSTRGWSRRCRDRAKLAIVLDLLSRPAPIDARLIGSALDDGALDRRISGVQPLLVLALVALCVAGVHPLGLSGRGLVGVLLLITCAALALSRNAPEHLVAGRYRLGLALVGTVAAGMFAGYDPGSLAVAFSYLFAYHLGFRFVAPVAVTGGALLALSTSAGLVIFQPDIGSRWWVLLSTATIALGMARRSRSMELRNARELAQQAQLASAAQARERELALRADVAREIHDVLSHSLSGVTMQLGMAEALLDAGRIDDARTAVVQARSLAKDGLGEAKRAVRTLREGALDLQPALAAIVLPPAERFVAERDSVPLPAATAQTALRVAQEAITNARRHAPGGALTVTLRWPSAAQNDLEVLVHNDAGTMEPAGQEGSGMGLMGMRERAALAGGSVTAGPDGTGWLVRLVLPVGESR